MLASTASTFRLTLSAAVLEVQVAFVPASNAVAGPMAVTTRRRSDTSIGKTITALWLMIGGLATPFQVSATTRSRVNASVPGVTIEDPPLPEESPGGWRYRRCRPDHRAAARCRRCRRISGRQHPVATTAGGDTKEDQGQGNATRPAKIAHALKCPEPAPLAHPPALLHWNA